MILLELTETETLEKSRSERRIWINFERVGYMRINDFGTILLVDGSMLSVKEKPKKIFEMLNQIEAMSTGEYLEGELDA